MNYTRSQKYVPFENPPQSPFTKGGNGSPPFEKGGWEGFKNEHITLVESEHIFENSYKWGSVKSHKALVKEFTRKISGYPNARGATIGKRIFLRKKPTANARIESDVFWYGLEDLCGRSADE